MGKGSRIRSIHARQIIDCKTRGMIETDVITEDGHLGRECAPTGTSTGTLEALVLRDDPETAVFNGTSVKKAVDMVNQIIAPKLIGMDVMDQESIDRRMIELDGTFTKSRLGGNSIYSISAAVMRAAAACGDCSVAGLMADGKEIRTIPVPITNMFNGGKYDNVKMELQEFGVIPFGASGIEEAVDILLTCFVKIGEKIKKRGLPSGIANYFGHLPFSKDPIDLFSMIAETIDQMGCGDKVMYYTDCAAGEFYDASTGLYSFMGKQIEREELLEYYVKLTSMFPFYAIEDVVADDDFEGYRKAASMMPDIRIVGDDLICTKKSLLEKALEKGSCSAIIMKPNQVGTITECLETVRYAEENGVLVIPSIRAGGSVTDPAKEMAVGLGAPLIKTGAPRSGERISVLAELLRAGDLYPDAVLAPLKMK